MGEIMGEEGKIMGEIGEIMREVGAIMGEVAEIMREEAGTDSKIYFGGNLNSLVKNYSFIVELYCCSSKIELYILVKISAITFSLRIHYG